MSGNSLYIALMGHYPPRFLKKPLKCAFACLICAFLAYLPCFAKAIPWDGLTPKNNVQSEHNGSEKNAQEGSHDKPRDETPKKYFLPTGFTFPVVMAGAVYSYLIESPCICIVEFPVEYLGREMIPKGTRLIGSARLYPNTNRIIINFQVMVFPNGEEMTFQGISLQDDPEGLYHLALGVPGKEGKTASKLPAQVLLGALNAAASASASASMTGGVASQTVSNAAQSVVSSAQQKLSYVPDYTVTVPKGTPVQVFNVQRIEY